ncbi:unnamed protein product, partial [Timema podura]|nr:unnamed protein product [Timema podura]
VRLTLLSATSWWTWIWIRKPVGSRTILDTLPTGRSLSLCPSWTRRGLTTFSGHSSYLLYRRTTASMPHITSFNQNTLNLVNMT